MRLTGDRELRDRLASLAGRLRDMNPGLLRAGVAVLTDAQGRIRSKGDGSWAPTLETQRGTSLFRSGALFRSLTIGAPGNIEQEIPGGLRVGTDLRTPTGNYSIGVLMQGGTGVFGPTGQPIKPRGKFLVFNLNGSKIFARSVKGSPPRPFLYIDDAGAKKVQSILADYVWKGDA